VTLYKHFKHEMANGSALLHSLVASKFHDAIDKGAPWALMMALRNLPGYRFDRYDKGVLPFAPGNDEPTDIRISFVCPSKRAEPIDVMPPSPYPPDAPADYSKPALPVPPERIKTEFGIVEHPRSVFDRGAPNDWMK
jgi:hypothetical protein